MKNHYIIYFVCCILYTNQILSNKVPASEIKVWLELDAVRQKMNANITKYTNLQAELTNDTNSILESSIQVADNLVDDDRHAALAIYYEMQKLKNRTDQNNLNIQEVNKKYKQLSRYVDQQIKELTDARRKHLQFP